MSHKLIRATLVPIIITLIAEKHGVSETVATDMFYNSATAASFGDDETGLYGQSALFTFSLFEEEYSDYERE